MSFTRFPRRPAYPAAAMTERLAARAERILQRDLRTLAAMAQRTAPELTRAKLRNAHSSVHFRDPTPRLSTEVTPAQGYLPLAAE
jgi:hypothetical protein